MFKAFSSEPGFDEFIVWRLDVADRQTGYTAAFLLAWLIYPVVTSSPGCLAIL
jgi:hypothetical protein